MKQTLITTAVPFLVLLVVVRYLSPEAFGAFALAQVYAIVAIGVFTLGLHIGYERNFFKHAEDRYASSALLHSVVGFVLLSYGCVVLLTLANLEFVTGLVGIEDGLLLMVVLLGQGCERVSQFYLLYFRNSELAGRYASYMVLAAILNASLALILIIVLDLGIVGLATGYALAWFCVVTLAALRVATELPPRVDAKILREALRISLPVTPRTLVVVLGAQSDKYILGLLGTVGGVGVYNIAFRISSVINSYMIALQNAYTPRLYRTLFSGQTAEKDDLGRYLTLITYFSILPAVGIAIFASEIVFLLLPVEFAAAAEVLVVLALYYGIIFFGKIGSVQLVYAEKTGLTTLFSIVFAVLNIALNIPLIFYFGVLGAALATLLTGGLYTLTCYHAAQKYCRVAWEGGPTLVIVSTLLVSGSAALVLGQLIDDLLLLVIVKLPLALFYAFLGVRLGFFSAENIRSFVVGLRTSGFQTKDLDG